MLEIGVQSINVIEDKNPLDGFERLKRTGFDCCDFGLNGYLSNYLIYQTLHNGCLNTFFNKSEKEMNDFFSFHKEAANKAGIRINQMHMPYPIFVPGASDEVNEYLIKEVAPKSLHICSFFNCKYIVMHGLKLTRVYGDEEAEWKETRKCLEEIIPLAKELGITICIENLYVSIGSNHLVEGPCCNAKKAIQRIDDINTKYGAEVLGFCFDTGHANIVGIDFESFLTILGKHLKVLHIHDNDGIRDLHQMPFTFSKTRENAASTDWEAFLRGLSKIHFDGVLSFETGPVLNAFPQELQEDVLEMLARIGRYFKRRILELQG